MARPSEQVDLDVLQDLLDLEEIGERVVWPRGMTPQEARRMLKDKKRTSPSASSSATPDSASTAQHVEGPPPRSDVANKPCSSLPTVPEDSEGCEGGVSDERILVEAFRCPITQQRMRDPVVTPSGHSYEGAAIRRVASDLGFSPQTKRKLHAEQLIPNRALKDAIEELRKMETTEDLVVRGSRPRRPTVPAPSTGTAAPATPPRKRGGRLQAHASAPKDPPAAPPARRLKLV